MKINLNTGIGNKKDDLFVNAAFWMNYEYEDENYPLFFVELPNLSNTRTINLLRLFDELYGDTDQETTDWALEYQLLSRFLITGKQLLVNPKYLDISDPDVFRKILDTISNKRIYKAARSVSQEQILRWASEY